MTLPPSQLEFDVVLRDGSTVYLRPIRPTDGQAVVTFYRGLSPESRHFRFFGMTDLERTTASLLAACEGGRGFFLGAELAGRLVGIAGYVRCEQSPGEADVALAIADSLQGHGLGTHLLGRLTEIGRDRGLRAFSAQVLASNAKMLRVFFDSGFDVQQRRDEDVIEVTIALETTEDVERLSQARAHEAASASMRGFFEPKTMAVIGASRRPGKIGSTILENLRRGGFTGRLVAVNPCAAAINGTTVYPSVSAIPGLVDLAIVAVPPDHVDGAIDGCLAKGIRSLVVITAGFGEMGAAGRAREEALLRKVRSAGARLVGPNCLGVMNTDPRVRLNATFSPVEPLPGTVALSTQSGALGLALLDHAARLNLGISTFISVGNKADVSGNDLIQYWAEDPRTSVILLYLESFGDPRQFSRIARGVACQKPIVVVKAGKSRAGARAAASHTGALAASDAVVDGLFRQAGIIRTATLEQFFDVAVLLAHGSVPQGPRVAVLTNAGGPGILAADACETGDLQLPPLSAETTEALRAFLPATASLGNPVDMIASASPTQFSRATAAMLADPGVDSLIVVYTPVMGSEPVEVANAIADASAGARKPVLVVWFSAGVVPPSLAALPVYRFPEAAAEALVRVTRYGAWRGQAPGRVAELSDVREPEARAIVEQALGRGDGWLTPPEAHALLGAVGIPVVMARPASSEEDAVRAADALGYPVVLKAIGPTIVHKTDMGGVALGLTDGNAVRRAHRDFVGRLGSALTGVLVQQQMAPGVELLVGAVVDPVFGPIVGCGSGGVLVELLKDTVFRLHPLTERDAIEMLHEMKGAQLLRGYRGAPPADAAAVRSVLLRVSVLIKLCPEIQEIDVNPLIVHRTGAVAVDSRVRVGRTTAPTSRRVRY